MANTRASAAALAAGEAASVTPAGEAACVTPVVLQNDTKPPYYGAKYSETASRAFYTRYVEYEKRVAHANTGGAVQRELAPMAQLIPNPVQRVLARMFKYDYPLSPEDLQAAVKKHAGHEAGADVDLSAASAAVAKAVAMDRKGTTMLERVEPIMSGLETFFAENPNFEAIYRSPDGSYIKGPAEIITKALVDGLAPDKFKQDVMVTLKHKGSWKNNPNLVMDTLVDAAKEWRKVESLQKPSVASKHTPRSQGAKSSRKSASVCPGCGQQGHAWSECPTVVCYGCGQTGHIKPTCPTSSEAAKGQSGDSNRNQQRSRKNRQGGGQSRGGGSSSGGGNSSHSVSSQSGASGSGPGVAAGAAPQRAVQVGSTAAVSSTVPAPVMASATPPVTALGVSSSSAPAGVPLAPLSTGYGSFPPTVPFGPLETPSAAPPAQPWRQVNIAPPRPATEVPVEFADKYIPAELFLPNQRERGAISVPAVLDSGAHFTSLSQLVVEQLERFYPETRWEHKQTCVQPSEGSERKRM